MALQLKKYNTEVYAGGEIAPPLQVDKSNLPEILMANRDRRDKAKLAADKARRDSAEKYYEFVQKQSNDIDAIDNQAIEDRRAELYSTALKKQRQGTSLMQDAELMNTTSSYLDAREASANRKKLRTDIPKNADDPYIKKDKYVLYATENLNNTPLDKVSSWVAPNPTASQFKSFDYLNDLTKDLKNQKKSGSYISDNASKLGETITDWAEITNLPEDKIPMFIDLAYDNNDTFKLVADGVGAEKALAYREQLKSEGKTEEEIDAIMKVPNQEWNGEMITREELFIKEAVKDMVDPFITSSKEVDKKIVKKPVGRGASEEDAKVRKQLIYDAQQGDPNALAKLKQGRYNGKIITDARYDTSGDEGKIILELTDKRGEKSAVELSLSEKAGGSFNELSTIYNTVKGEKQIGTDLMQKVPEAERTTKRVKTNERLLNTDIEMIQNDPEGGAEILNALPGVSNVKFEDDYISLEKDGDLIQLEYDEGGESIGDKKYPSYEAVKNFLMKTLGANKYNIAEGDFDNIGGSDNGQQGEFDNI